jgi:3-deoxy-D-manno-octulosonate 8-phosphate phosphatase (KDO 8-P phosphatase)
VEIRLFCTLNIKNVVTDVDGVLTDGKFLYNNIGKVMKRFGPHDSDGFKILKSLGLNIQAISADKRGFSITKKRLTDMGVELTLVSEVGRLDWIRSRYKLDETMFIGDGYFDIDALQQCAIGVAPQNAPDLIRESANAVTSSRGSEGVIFELALKFLEDRNKLKLNEKNF